MNLSAYRLALDAATGGIVPVVTRLIFSLYRGEDRQAEIRQLAPVLVEVIRGARYDAHEAATEFLLDTAEDHGIEDPYVPELADYSINSVETVLREDLRGAPNEAAERISARLSQHVEDAARQTVVRSVEDYREPATEADERHYSYAALRGTDADDDEIDREFRESQARSWARVLTGAENCAFCVMLASRGPVYETAESAGRIAASDLFREAGAVGWANSYHPNCDCLVVPIYDYNSWPGQDQFSELRKFYKRTVEDATWTDADGNEHKGITYDKGPGWSQNKALSAIERELRRMANEGESLPITDIRTGEPMRTAAGSIAA
jgi:hypothetical protein